MQIWPIIVTYKLGNLTSYIKETEKSYDYFSVSSPKWDDNIKLEFNQIYCDYDTFTTDSQQFISSC
jgi:hypothetical protein